MATHQWPTHAHGPPPVDAAGAIVVVAAAVRALVVTGGYALSTGLVHLAKAHNVTVIQSPKPRKLRSERRIHATYGYL